MDGMTDGIRPIASLEGSKNVEISKAHSEAQGALSFTTGSTTNEKQDTIRQDINA